jgi:hypothetical protein
MRFVMDLALATALALSTGAQAQLHGPGGAAAPIHSGGVLELPQTPNPPDTASMATFYEHSNLTGASYSVSVSPVPNAHAELRITSSDVAAHGLKGGVSAVRLQCGSRPSRIALFDLDWGEFSKGASLDCDPGQSATLDLTTVVIHDTVTANDKINAAVFVTHVRSADDAAHPVPASFLLASVWKQKMKEMDSAKADRTRIWLEDSHSIHIYQSIKLDSWACSERGAVFNLRIKVSTVAFKPVFDVRKLDQYVDFGTGDLWGCRKKMMAGLNDEVEKQIPKIKSGMMDMVKAFGEPSSPDYYFVPEGDTGTYDLFYRR